MLLPWWWGWAWARRAGFLPSLWGASGHRAVPSFPCAFSGLGIKEAWVSCLPWGRKDAQRPPGQGQQSWTEMVIMWVAGGGVPGRHSIPRGPLGNEGMRQEERGGGGKGHLSGPQLSHLFSGGTGLSGS